MSANATRAYIDSSSINNAKTVVVQSITGGAETAVGIGLAAGASSNAASLSASVGLISDSSNAYISNSTLSGSTAASGRQIDVDAYQSTKIGIGGGSLYLSGGRLA